MRILQTQVIQCGRFGNHFSGNFTRKHGRCAGAGRAAGRPGSGGPSAGCMPCFWYGCPLSRPSRRRDARQRSPGQSLPRLRVHARRGPDRPQACSREPGPAAMSMVRGAAPATNRAHISRYARSSSSARRAGLNRAALAPFGEQSAPERGEAVRVAGEFDRDRLVLVERGCHQLGQTGRAQDA